MLSEILSITAKRNALYTSNADRNYLCLQISVEEKGIIFGWERRTWIVMSEVLR